MFVRDKGYCVFLKWKEDEKHNRTKDLKDVVRASRTERTIYQHLIRNDEACLITLTNLTFFADVWYTWVSLSVHITPLLQPLIYHSYLNPFQEGKAEKLLLFWCVHAYFMIIFDPCVILSCSWTSAVYIISSAAAVFVMSRYYYCWTKRTHVPNLLFKYPGLW